MPKLCVFILGEFGNLSEQEKANETAAGYHHTYFHCDDIDVKALMEWPTDGQLEDILGLAHEDVEELLSALGMALDAQPSSHGVDGGDSDALPDETNNEESDLEGPQHTLNELLHSLHISTSLSAADELTVESLTLALTTSQIDASQAM